METKAPGHGDVPWNAHILADLSELSPVSFS